MSNKRAERALSEPTGWPTKGLGPGWEPVQDGWDLLGAGVAGLLVGVWIWAWLIMFFLAPPGPYYPPLAFDRLTLLQDQAYEYRLEEPKIIVKLPPERPEMPFARLEAVAR